MYCQTASRSDNYYQCGITMVTGAAAASSAARFHREKIYTSAIDLLSTITCVRPPTRPDYAAHAHTPIAFMLTLSS